MITLAKAVKKAAQTREQILEEAISDILAMRLIPHDKNLGDTAIRGLKFQENFPETIACVDKIFSK